jgi:hypothetical protein
LSDDFYGFARQQSEIARRKVLFAKLDVVDAQASRLAYLFQKLSAA